MIGRESEGSRLARDGRREGAIERRGERLGLAALVVCVLALLYGVLVPTYTDEVVWRLQERAGLDGGRDAMFNDICGPHTILTPPAFMMPVRWFSAAVNSVFADPLIVRIEGVLCGLLFLALMWKLINAAEPVPARRGPIRAVAFSLLALGALPLMMTMSRPEQPLLLATGAVIVLALTGHRDASPARAWLRAAAIVALSAIALSYHLKGVLYAVVALAGMGWCARGRATLLPRVGGAAAIVAVSAMAAQYWSTRFACPGDPVLATNLAGQNIVAELARGGDLAATLVQMLRNALPAAYLLQTAPAPMPMSQWLPPNLLSRTAQFAYLVLIVPAWVAAVGLALAHLARHALNAPRAALAEPRLVLATAILACLVLWSASQTTKNFYEAAHVMPMLAVVTVLGLSLPRRSWGIGPRIAGLFVLAAVASLAGVVAFTAKPLLATAAEGGYDDAQPFSYSGFGFARTRADAQRAMRAAGFPVDRRLRRVLIDDGTYFALHDSFMPLHRVGVLHVWNGAIRNPAAYLVSRGSDGIVMRCAYLPPQLRAVAARSGQVCAVAETGLRRAAGR